MSNLIQIYIKIDVIAIPKRNNLIESIPNNLNSDHFCLRKISKYNENNPYKILNINYSAQSGIKADIVAPIVFKKL